MWAYNFGCTILVTVIALYTCAAVNATGRVAIVALPLVIVFLFMLVLIVSCFKCQWFNSDLRQRNSCKVIIKVLNFAQKHKYALRHNVITYCDDEKPSRLDFGKAMFGGPFTTEQV